MTRYFLNTFSSDSWNHYLGLVPPSLGTLRPREDIQIGDIFLCYVKQEGRVSGQWVGAERVASAMYYDDRQLYKAGVWPYRWKVEPAVTRRPYGEGVPGRSLVDEMVMFRRMQRKNWGSALRTQAREIPEEDGDLIVRILNER